MICYCSCSMGITTYPFGRKMHLWKCLISRKSRKQFIINNNTQVLYLTFLWLQSLFMESIGLKCIQLFPSHPQLKIVFIDVIHKNKTKNQPLKEGLSCELNVKLLDRVHQIIFLLQASPTRFPIWGQKCMFSLPFALQNTLFLSCMPPIPCKGYELKAAKPAGNEPLRTAQDMWSQGSATYICDLLETRLPNVLAFPFTTKEISASTFFPLTFP